MISLFDFISLIIEEDSGRKITVSGHSVLSLVSLIA
jgi:hypothetical protein